MTICKKYEFPLLGDERGSLVVMDKQSGMSFTFIEQPSPDGLAQANILAEEFLDGAPSAMVLGDNLFFGHGLSQMLIEVNATENSWTIFGYRVSDPERYGVIRFDADDRAVEIIEKPATPPSKIAITGLYFLDGTAPAREVKPSDRGESDLRL